MSFDLLLRMHYYCILLERGNTSILLPLSRDIRVWPVWISISKHYNHNNKFLDLKKKHLHILRNIKFEQELLQRTSHQTNKKSWSRDWNHYPKVERWGDRSQRDEGPPNTSLFGVLSKRNGRYVVRILSKKYDTKRWLVITVHCERSITFNFPCLFRRVEFVFHCCLFMTRHRYNVFIYNI